MVQRRGDVLAGSSGGGAGSVAGSVVDKCPRGRWWDIRYPAWWLLGALDWVRVTDPVLA